MTIKQSHFNSDFMRKILWRHRDSKPRPAGSRLLARALPFFQRFESLCSITLPLLAAGTLGGLKQLLWPRRTLSRYWWHGVGVVTLFALCWLPRYFRETKMIPTPGIEPGPPGWEPDILTTRPCRTVEKKGKFSKIERRIVRESWWGNSSLRAAWNCALARHAARPSKLVCVRSERAKGREGSIIRVEFFRRRIGRSATENFMCVVQFGQFLSWVEWTQTCPNDANRSFLNSPIWGVGIL